MLADISVIIPAYNRAGLIGETLQSLLKQTLPAKEIIVVDDGSTDGTAEEVEHEFSVFREQFSGNSKSNIQNPTFKVLRQQNAGPGAARNRGLAEATGEFIHFFDSDDIASPNKHEVQLHALLETGADIACGPWVKGRFGNLTTEDTEDTEDTEEEAVLRLGKPSGAAFSNPSTSELARASENTSLTRCASAPAYRFSGFRSQISGFSAEGPIRQARGLPKVDLIKALLTNWSIVPHACLFRRSILEKAGGFPEDIWVGEDQLLFLRCLLADAKVVHTPETMVFYRLGNDLGKLTATGAAQKRHARDWARFLVKANEEVSSAEWRVVGKTRCVTTEDTTELRGRCEMEQPKVGPKGERVGTIESKDTEEEDGARLASQAGATFLNPFISELARDSESTSPTRSATGPAGALFADHGELGSAGGNQLADSMEFLEDQSQAGLQMDNKKNHNTRSANDLLASRKQSDDNPVNLVNPVKNCFGFRLRAYEAWRDLEKFFPKEESELKNELQGIWKRNWFSGSKFQVSGFVLRKLGGLKLRVLGYREHASFRCGKFSSF
jgi:glycosyltransferase involved in cell wall biosynthesis